MKMTLLVIDMQKEYNQGPAAESMESASEYINAAVDLFRQSGQPVVWIQDSDREEGVVPGTPGFDLIDQLKPLPGEERVIKEYSNSFNKTNLLEILNIRRPDLLLITGYCAEHCVLSTYRGARDHDLTPVLLKNGVAGGDRENIAFVEKISDILSWNVLRKMLTS